jgi:hypothetical protein
MTLNLTTSRRLRRKLLEGLVDLDYATETILRVYRDIAKLFLLRHGHLAALWHASPLLFSD